MFMRRTINEHIIAARTGKKMEVAMNTMPS
jgi:hypothetical protein